MMNKLILLSVALFSTMAMAESSAVVLKNGSVAICNEGGDANSRAYRLKVLSTTDTQILLQLETLICVKDREKMLHIPSPLSHRLVFHNDRNIITYEINHAFIQVTNSEGTQELAKLAINPHLAIQQLVLDTSKINLSTIDLTIQSLQVMKVNNRLSDQGMVFGGNYRIIKN